MRRYDVDRIVLALVEEGQDNSSKYGFGLGDVIRFTPMQVGTILSDLDIEPELIRCKDCKYWYDAPASDGYNSCEKDALIRHKDFYCAEAERKEADMRGDT